jgi:type IV pilus assembly protein PilE
MNAAHPRIKGFSLIELLIVLFIVGVLAALALPAYDEHIRRAHRAEARTGLLHAAHRLEREATAAGVYPSGALPESLAVLPSGRYRIERSTPTDAIDAATRFRLRATPQGAQAQDKCGSLTLTHTGERGLANNTASVADCWNR